MTTTNIHDSNFTSNGNFCDTIFVPSAKLYFENIRTPSLIFIIVAVVLAFCLLFIYIAELVFVFKYISSDSSRAGQIAWLLAVYPVTSLLSVIGAAVPRSMPITNMFMLLFFARLLFVYTQLIIDLFGGRISMASEVHGTHLKSNVGPCFCCCVCLPTIKPTIIHIRRIEMLVYQAAIIRPLLFFACGAAWADMMGDVKTNSAFFKVFSVINLLSTLTAMYGYNLFASIAANPLKDFCITTQMKLMQILMLLVNLQGNILELLAGPNGPIYCDHILTASARASLFNFVLIPIESLLLSLGTAWFLRPEVNAIFDLHPKWKRKPSAREVNEFLMKRERDSEARLSNGQVITKQDIKYLNIPHSKSAPTLADNEFSPLPKFSITGFQDDDRETNV